MAPDRTGANGRRLVVGYVALYCAAGWLDLWTTRIAVSRPGVSEANVFATDAGAYAASQAWLATAVGGLIMLACVVFAVTHAGSVAPNWLRHPIRSFATLYVSPWSMLDRSPLHLLSLALAFPVVRLFAAANNVLLILGEPGPLGVAVRWVGARSSPVMGLGVVMGGLYLVLTVAASPIAARSIESLAAHHCGPATGQGDG